MRTAANLCIALALAAGATPSGNQPRPIAAGPGIPVGQELSTCAVPLDPPSGSFPCATGEGASLLCPDGRVEWLVVDSDRKGCPARTRRHSYVPVAKGIPIVPPLANTPMRARWAATGDLSEVLFASKPRCGSIRTPTGIVLWSLDGKPIQLHDPSGRPLTIGKPVFHPIADATSGSEAFFRHVRRGGWDWVYFGSDPLPEFVRREPVAQSAQILAQLENHPSGTRLAWFATSPRFTNADTTGLEVLAFPPDGTDTIHLVATSRSGHHWAGEAVFPGRVDSLVLVMRRRAVTETRFVARPADISLGDQTRPAKPVHDGVPATTHFDPPPKGPWSTVVLAIGDSLFWAIPNASGTLAAPYRSIPSSWGWAFDRSSPSGRAQFWENSARVVRMDSIRSTSSGVRFRFPPAAAAPCLAYLAASGEFGEVALGPGSDDPAGPDLSGHWLVVEQTLGSDEFLRLNGWSYKPPSAEAPTSAPLRGQLASGSPAASISKPMQILPSRRMGHVCPDSLGWYDVPVSWNPTRQTGRVELYGADEAGSVRFRIDLPLSLNGARCEPSRPGSFRKPLAGSSARE